MPSKETTKRFLNATEVAEELDCHPDYVYSMLQNGALRGFRVGRRWRITREAIDEFVAAGGGGRASA